MNKTKTRPEKRKDRTELERKFLSSVLSITGCGNYQEIINRYSRAEYRSFTDKRHRVLWRALQTLDLSRNQEERIKILLEEQGLSGEDLADNLGLEKKLKKEAAGNAWLEHELGAAGVLRLIGGKVYLRKLCPDEHLEDNEFLTDNLFEQQYRYAVMKDLAGQLGFKQKEKKE